MTYTLLVPLSLEDLIQQFGPYGHLISLFETVIGRSGSCKYALPDTGFMQIFWEQLNGKQELGFGYLQEHESELLGQWSITVGSFQALEASFAVDQDPFPMLGTQVVFRGGGYLWRIHFVTSMARAQYERVRLERVLRALHSPTTTSKERANSGEKLPPENDHFWSIQRKLEEVRLRYEELPEHISDLVAFERKKISAPYLNQVRHLRVELVLNALLDIGAVSGTCVELLEQQAQRFRANMFNTHVRREVLARKVRIPLHRIDSLLDSPIENARSHLQSWSRIAAVLGTPLFGIKANPKPTTFILHGDKVGCARDTNQ